MFFKDNGIITFYYKTDAVFDRVSSRTLFRARLEQKKQDGNDAVDYLAIQEDEKPFMIDCLEEIMPRIFRAVVKLTTGVPDSLFINAELVVPDPAAPESGTVTVTASGFKLVDKDAYNDNLLECVDNSIKMNVIYRIMEKWYQNIRFVDASKEVEIEVLKVQRQLTDDLFDLRKPVL